MKEKTDTYYVYALIDPRTSQPFYIGKGKTGTSRHKRHFYESVTTTENIHKFYKIQFLLSGGYEVPVKIICGGLSERIPSTG